MTYGSEQYHMYDMSSRNVSLEQWSLYCRLQLSLEEKQNNLINLLVWGIKA